MSAMSIAVTGGIASGKSTVTKLFERLGIEVFDADVIARSLVEPGKEAFEEIVARWGQGVLGDAGQLDRAKMRQRVFAEPEQRRMLESILHPRVRDALNKASRKAKGVYVLLAIPLLVESGSYDWVSRVLLVDVPRHLQLHRLLARDGTNSVEAELILAAQATRDQRWSAAHDVIINDGNPDNLAAMVARLDRRYRSLAAVQTHMTP